MTLRTRLADQVPLAVVGGRLLTDLVDVTDDLEALDSSGTWAVVIPFSGPTVCARFSTVQSAVRYPWDPWRDWAAVPPEDWRSSLDHDQFCAAVQSIRSSIGDGDVYQVNLTRVLSTKLHPNASIAALGAALGGTHAAPFSAVVRIPAHGVHVASASPERFLERDGDRIWSSPIKGTAARGEEFLPKDRAENIMIVDLVRNDLGRVCEWGTVKVPDGELLAIEEHPGLTHLVSTVEGWLRPGHGWAEAIGATFPPGSVTGAPKEAALEHIARLETAEREVYCGAVGWVDADRKRGALNVAIRTFWFSEGELRFGTGGGITWDSDPEGEWRETNIKAGRLTRAAARGLAPGSIRTDHTGTP